MIHARDDYNRIQDPALADPSLLSPGSTPIGEDEPVFLLRAQDENFLEMVAHYRGLTWKTARPLADRCDAQIDRARRWQETHPVKTPDL